MTASKCPGRGRHWFAGASFCTRCGAESPESVAFRKRRARTDDCGGTGWIGYGRRVYPSAQAAFARYRPCEGVGCHPARIADEATNADQMPAGPFGPR